MYVDDSRLSTRALLRGTARERNLKTFHYRTPHPDNTRSCQEELKKILASPEMQRMTFGIMSGYELPTENAPRLKRALYGLTSTDCYNRNPSIKFWISYELLVTFLRSDLTPGELLGAQTLVATTMIHELMHAFHKAKVYRDLQALRKKPSSLDFREPYFMVEPIKECGFSAENAVCPFILLITH